METKTDNRPNREPADIKAQILECISIADDQEFTMRAQQLIGDRLADLEATSNPSLVSIMSEEHHGFVHPETKIVQLAFLPGGVVLDDDTFYQRFLDRMRSFRESADAQEKTGEAYERLTFFAAQYAVQDYFGNVGPTNEEEDDREALIMQSAVKSIEEPEETYSIRNIGKSAMCIERAAVANNILAFAGFETHLIVGGLKVQGGRGSHGYVVFRRSNGEDWIFDAMNPSMDFEGDQLVQTTPAVYPGGGAILEHESVAAELPYFEIKDGERTETRRHKLEYEPNTLAKLKKIVKAPGEY